MLLTTNFNDARSFVSTVDSDNFHTTQVALSPLYPMTKVDHDLLIYLVFLLVIFIIIACKDWTGKL